MRLQNLLSTLLCGMMTLTLRSHNRLDYFFDAAAIVLMALGVVCYVRGAGR